MVRGSTTRGVRFPPAALDWLVGPAPLRVLALSGSALPRTLHRAGHDVFAVDTSTEVVGGLRNVATAVVAQAESLPFDPCQFDVVSSHQVFHRYAPGLVLSEMARVLRPGGHVGVSYLVRDDSVPWVRRLVAHVQALDPHAMAGSFGTESVRELTGSKYFPRVEQKDFRQWVPLGRGGLVAMVEALPAVRGLADPERRDFLDLVQRLHDEVAPGSGDLLLPYQLRCWRAHVDHDELSAPIEIDDDGLVIPL